MHIRLRGLTPIFIKIVILLILFFLLIVCISLFWPRFVYEEGITQLKLKNYEQAIPYFEKAEKAMPEVISDFFGQADFFRIYTNYGKALYHFGIKNWKENGISFKSFDIFARAKYLLEKADKIESRHYINKYWLTRTEQALEKSYAWLYPGKSNPYNAYAFYQQVLPLRPSGITARYSFARYLYYKKLNKQIPELVQYMMEIHPPSYRHLRKEPFYNEELISYIERGLNSAIKKDILTRDALEALSTIYLIKNDFEKAISYYQELLDYKPSSNSSDNHIHLGSLYLKSLQFKKSYKIFENVILKSDNPNIINSIYSRFKSEKLFLQFLNFYSLIQNHNLSNQVIEMVVARCWLDMEYPQFAKARLIQINAAKPHAPAYYLLAQIAQKEKKWSQMERAVQKATRLDQDNAGYHYLFSQALNYQNKYTHAEEAAAKAIYYAPKNPGFFNHRAWLRWRQGKYIPAAEDWKTAFTFKSDHSDFPYRIALVYEREGFFKKASIYIEKALALAPDNKNYQNLKKRLKKGT
jgi:tetratricopeptide (TPR) repeat protein